MLRYYVTMFSLEICFSLFLIHSNSRAVFLEWAGGTLPLRGQLEISGDLFDCHDSGQGQVLAPPGYGLVMPLNILEYTGQAPSMEWSGPQSHYGRGGGTLFSRGWT